MKKFFFALVLLELFSISGCSNDQEPVSATSTLPASVISNNSDPIVNKKQNSCGVTSVESPKLTKVVSFEVGYGGGFNWKKIPDIVLGTPKGGGTAISSLDVLSLGEGGSITLELDQPVEDQPGPDLIVFENVWYIDGDPKKPFAEPGEVSVSQDGKNFVPFPCQNRDWENFYPGCAGVHPVYANSNTNVIDPTDPSQAGGEAFDLEQIKTSCIRFIKIKDATPEEELHTFLPKTLDDDSNEKGKAGFDLDAVSIIHKN